MGVAARIDPRNLPRIAVVAILAAGLGITSGVQPKLGVEAALGLVFMAAVIGDLTLGLCLFTVLSFLEVMNVGGPALSLMKVAGLLLAVSWVAASATRGRHEPRALLTEHPALAAGAVLLVSWSAISVAWAPSRGAAITSTERYLLNVLLLPIVFNAIRRRKDVVWILGAFLLGAVASAAYGFLQSSGARLAGAIGDPNEEAAVLVAAVMLAIGLSALTQRGSKAKSWVFAAGIVAAVGLLNTVSRGGLVAFACTLVAGVLFGGRWRPKAVLFIVLALISAGLFFSVLAPLAARQHLNSTNSTGRTDLWRVGWSMFKANPLTGVGSGNFPNSAIHYVQQAGPLTRADLIVNVPHVTHNLYLDILDELGVPGLLAFVLIAGASISAAVRAAKRFELAGDTPLELTSRVMALAILGVLAADFFLSGQFSKQLWLLLALPPPLLALARSEHR